MLRQHCLFKRVVTSGYSQLEANPTGEPIRIFKNRHGTVLSTL